MNSPLSEDREEKGDTCARLRFIARIFLFLPGISLGIPILVSFVYSIPLSVTLALVGSTFLIEYGAVIPGIALGIGYLPTIVIISAVALSVILTSLELFDTLEKESDRVKNFLEAIEKGRITGFVSKYGIWGLLPGIAVLGFYVCPGISWIFSWKRCYSVVLMLTGFVLSAILFYSFSAGIISVLF